MFYHPVSIFIAPTTHTYAHTLFYPVSLLPTTPTPCLTASVYPEYQWCRQQIDRPVCHMTLYVPGLYPRMTAGRQAHTHIHTPRDPQHGTLYLTEAWQWGKHRRTHSGKLMGMHTLNHRRGVSQAARERENTVFTLSFLLSCRQDRKALNISHTSRSHFKHACMSSCGKAPHQCFSHKHIRHWQTSTQSMGILWHQK